MRGFRFEMPIPNLLGVLIAPPRLLYFGSPEGHTVQEAEIEGYIPSRFSFPSSQAGPHLG